MLDRTSNLYYFYYGYLIFFRHTFINTIGRVNMYFTIFLFVTCLSFVCYLLIFIYSPLDYIGFTGLCTIQSHSCPAGQLIISMYCLCIFFYNSFYVFSWITPNRWQFFNNFVHSFLAFRAKIGVAPCYALK